MAKVNSRRLGAVLEKMKNKPSPAGWVRCVQQIWPIISMLIFAPCATAQQPVVHGVANPHIASTDVGWAHRAQQDVPYAQQDEKETAWHSVPDLIQQGRQALEAGQAEQAGLIFERILLEQPWQLGVWLDYALSLQQMGDYDSARAIYQNLLRQNPPEHLIPWLKRQVKIALPLVADWQYAGAITLLTGHDSNLNRAPTTNNLTLTLPSGALLMLPLTDASRASTGTSRLAGVDWQALRQGAAGGDWLLQAALNTRLSPDVKGQNYLQSSVGLVHSWMSASGRNYHAILTAQHLQYGGQDTQRTLRAGLYHGHTWQTGDQTSCSVSYGPEWEMLAYPSISELDGQYFGFAADLGCKPNLIWQLLLRAGIDQAEHQRPGGNQWRTELRGQLGDQLGAGKWLAMTELTWLRDDAGYNTLLDNNAARDILHWLIKLEYQHPLGAGLNALASAEAFQQNSNLPLFAMCGKAAWIGIRYLF